MMTPVIRFMDSEGLNASMNAVNRQKMPNVGVYVV